ncbi:hypothetical protein QR680_005015 [Steinernema hermaphroditum]|uniref:Bardet-Biedl syndrome 2 protein homolog n=1 Tax=Steinernema hermaphroditum TaxID=289476 RepID=A0AA39HQK2_9BILA|nr:hypothetical protein QR680_005015 [Steinernema hermaphroditum]
MMAEERTEFDISEVQSAPFGHRINPRCVTKGQVDERPAGLIAGTATHKVVSNRTDMVLNVNEAIRCVATARINTPYDILIVGTTSQVMAYDVHNNTTLFQKDVPDGVNCIVVGKYSNIDDPLIICGGNYAIWGLDITGKDRFWTVTGDNVHALDLCDFDDDQENELLIGSDSFDIRVFKGDQMFVEISETDSVVCLRTIGNGNFGYALKSGSLGVYKYMKRGWKVKTKSSVFQLEVTRNGEAMLCGWTTGKIEVRDVKTGNLLAKTSTNFEISGLLLTQESEEALVPLEFATVSSNGHVSQMTMDKSNKQKDERAAELHDFGVRKHQILVELKNYEQTTGHEQDSEPQIDVNSVVNTETAINTDYSPPVFQLQQSVMPETSVIRMVILSGESIFPSEAHIIHPNSNFSSMMNIDLMPEKDVAVNLNIKTVVGFPNSTQFHVFEAEAYLPRFSMYAPCDDKLPDPQGRVEFLLKEKPEKISLWIQENFLHHEGVQVENEELNVRFFDIRKSAVLKIHMNKEGKVEIMTDDFELAGNLIQAISETLQLDVLRSKAEFPAVAEEIGEIAAMLHDLYTINEKLSTEWAEKSSIVRQCVLRSEDYLMTNQIKLARKHYVKLMQLNDAMVVDWTVRRSNKERLWAMLRQLHKIMDKSARLRVGEPATQLIAACREALRNQNFAVLPKILLHGSPLRDLGHDRKEEVTRRRRYYQPVSGIIGTDLHVVQTLTVDIPVLMPFPEGSCAFCVSSQRKCPPGELGPKGVPGDSGAPGMHGKDGVPGLDVEDIRRTVEERPCYLLEVVGTNDALIGLYVPRGKYKISDDSLPAYNNMNAVDREHTFGDKGEHFGKFQSKAEQDPGFWHIVNPAKVPSSVVCMAPIHNGM